MYTSLHIRSRTADQSVFHYHDRGFTLMELMVVVMVFAVVAGIGFPYLGVFLREGELTSRTSSIVTALKLARSESVSRGQPVMACASTFSTTPAQCDGENWAAGWLVATDRDGDGQVNSDGDIIRVDGAETDLSGTSEGAVRVRFTVEGVTASNRAQSIELQPEDCGDARARNIAISTTGRVQVNKADC